jgi:hypothetical protein
MRFCSGHLTPQHQSLNFVNIYYIQLNFGPHYIKIKTSISVEKSLKLRNNFAKLLQKI